MCPPIMLENGAPPPAPRAPVPPAMIDSLRSAPLVGLLCLIGQATLCSTPAGAQEAGPPNVNPQTVELYGKWLPLDRVALVVNGDIVTQEKIRRKVGKTLGGVSSSTPGELEQVFNQTHRTEIESLLIRQAGEDMGLPAERVAAHVAGLLRDETDEAGGSFAMSERLRDESTTALEFKESQEAQVYQDSFRRRAAGFGGSQERSPEDRYVRPGRLIQRYSRMLRTGQGIRALQGQGAVPAAYELQVLLLAPLDDSTTLKQSQDKALELQTALEAGTVGWDEMLDQFGVYPNSGLLGPQAIDALEFMYDPGDGQLLQFAADASQSQISKVMAFPQINPATKQRRLAGFAIYKLLDRSSASVPDFDGKDVQLSLRLSIEQEESQLRIGDAVSELARTAYIWSPSHDEELAAQEKAKAERTQRIQEARERNAEKLRQSKEKPPTQTPKAKP